VSRLALLLLLALVASASEYAPKPDQIQLYTWKVEQGAQWDSAGDKLRFDTVITWQLALHCTAVDGGRMRLAATFVKVVASHKGPGADVQVDSESGAGSDDPLLGHLIALAGKTLELDVDRATGAVATVSGGEAIIAAINRRAPAAIPGDPPPLDAAAQAAYGPDALARLWSQVLALPPAADGATPVTLPAPFAAGATAERIWKGQNWTLALPAGAQPPAFELAKDPTPVHGVVKNLVGSGNCALSKGLPDQASGKLSFTLVISALTQPVESVQTISWTLSALR